MIGLIFKLSLAFHLSRQAHRIGLRQPTMSMLSWWGWVLTGVVVEMILLRISLFGRDPYQRIDWIQLPLVASGLILIFVLVPAAVAWGIGRARRTPTVPEELMLYLFDDGRESGPFSLAQLRRMQEIGRVSSAAYVCRDGDPEWTSLADMTVATAKETPAAGGWLKSRLTTLRKAFQPSQKMNYRIFVPCVVLAMIVGALLHSWIGERYRFQAMGSGHMMKTDRWTGESWTTYAGNNIWRPVK